MLVDQKLQRFGLAQGQPQPLGRFFGDSQPDLAVILDEALAQVVDQQRQVQGPLLLDALVDAAQQAGVGDELGGPLDRPNAMFVDRVFVIFVELQQAAGVGERGNDLFQHAQLVQPAQQLAQAARLRNQATGTACRSLDVDFAGRIAARRRAPFPKWPARCACRASWPVRTSRSTSLRSVLQLGQAARAWPRSAWA